MRFSFVLTSLALLCYAELFPKKNGSHTYKVGQELEWRLAHYYQQRELSINQGIQESDRLVALYTFGIDFGLGKQMEQIHQDFQLQHLMTPSGLQVTPLVFLASKLLPRTWLAALLLIAYFLSLLFWQNTEFVALQRMLLFHSIQIFYVKKTNSHLTPVAFTLTFIVDFFFGTHSLSPYSFWLSFTFLGLIHIYRPASLLTGFLIVQLIVAMVFGDKFSIFHALIGQFFTLLSVGIFFAGMIQYFCHVEEILLPLCKGYYDLLIFIHEILPQELIFYPDLSSLITLMIIFCGRVKRSFLALLIFVPNYVNIL